jgi:phospholipid/cholesterol/gamma-HCH transport system substrate-binding protein
MENRSHALLAGLFTLAMLVAAAFAAIWIGRTNVQLMPYDLISNSPVTGLSVQSQVRYQGVPVGSVESLKFNQDMPGQIRIRIGINPKTPITTGTWAEIATQGVTGISNIELRDDGLSDVRLYSTPDHVHDIPMRPGFFERLQSRGGGMIGSLERIMSQVEKFTSDENAVSFSQAIENSARLTEQLNRTAQSLEPSIKKLPTLMDSMATTAKRIDAAALEITRLAVSAQDTVKLLNAPYGPMHQAAQSLQSLQVIAAQLRSSTLPDVNALSTSLSDAAQAFTRTSRQIGDAPQSLIFGAPLVMPGPGEPGFTGFGSLPKISR